jgi:hypothetical protein
MFLLGNKNTLPYFATIWHWYLKGSGQSEILEASEIIHDQVENSQERAEMIFMLAILAGRKYHTAGCNLLSPFLQ